MAPRADSQGHGLTRIYQDSTAQATARLAPRSNRSTRRAACQACPPSNHGGQARTWRSSLPQLHAKRVTPATKRRSTPAAARLRRAGSDNTVLTVDKNDRSIATAARTRRSLTVTKRARAWSVVALALASFVGCRGGKLLATAELKGPGKATVRFVATGRTIALSSDADADWTGSKLTRPEVMYEIDVVRRGKSVGRVSCNTLNSSTPRDGFVGRSTVCSGVSANGGDRQSKDCEYPLGCELPAMAAGEVELQVTGSVGPNVTKIRNMSLRVRSE